MVCVGQGGEGLCHLMVGDGLQLVLMEPPQKDLVLPQVSLAAHQHDGDALAEVIHLRVPLCRERDGDGG